jgi:CubicO group peptidase (beta-lactamase class C family)
MFEDAAAYHQGHKGQALIVSRGGKTQVEVYDAGFTDESPHALYSGTKSFWGITALIAQREGLLSLDERVSATFPQWKAEAWKRRVTLRELLQLTAGVPFGGLGASVPPYEKALAVDLKAAPGTTFTYGGIPLQIFGAAFSKKLDTLNMTPHDFLHARVLDPNQIKVASWRKLKDGTQPLPTGAFLTARNWLRYGEFVTQHAKEFAECFAGSSANPRYGLGWWLAFPKMPQDLAYASGSGGQGLYVIPSEGIIAVRFGGGGSFNHEAFLKRLLQRT